MVLGSSDSLHVLVLSQWTRGARSPDGSFPEVLATPTLRVPPAATTAASVFTATASASASDFILPSSSSVFAAALAAASTCVFLPSVSPRVRPLPPFHADASRPPPWLEPQQQPPLLPPQQPSLAPSQQPRSRLPFPDPGLSLRVHLPPRSPLFEGNSRRRLHVSSSAWLHQKFLVSWRIFIRAVI